MDRIRDIWGARTPFASGTAWPERVDEFLVDGVAASEVERWVRGACLLCSNGCGLEIAVRDGRMVGVRGRAEDRVNHGRLGPKGLYGWQGEQHERLTTPLIRQSGRLVETDWETAMSEVVARSRALLDAKGALSHGFFTCGQLMTEEYYTLAVIGKGGLGTPHMDGNTRLCTATASAAFQESFGCDGQPGSYTDIDSCDALFLFGHNVAETQTVLWARMLELSGAASDNRQMVLHAVTSRPMMTKYDPWVNMLRTCVAAFAAGVGGADSVTVLPFDSRLGLPDPFGRRIALGKRRRERRGRRTRRRYDGRRAYLDGSGGGLSGRR